jgi:hypothetical protein
MLDTVQNQVPEPDTEPDRNALRFRFREGKKLRFLGSCGSGSGSTTLPTKAKKPTKCSVTKIKRKISFKQCCGSMTFWCWSGSVSGFADPCLWLMDPAIFFVDLQDANKKLIKKKVFLHKTFWRYLHLHPFLKIKCQKKSQNSRNQGFSYYFC